MLGKVKFFDSKKGFGFITPNDGSADIFVHYTGIKPKSLYGKRNLVKGETVVFNVEQGRRGIQATDVE